MDRFDQITTFVRVVELGGFAAAARDLGVAPSLVTTHIQALEQRLGARLLNRNTRHVKPTEVGEAYYKYCVDVISRFDEAEALVESMQAKPRGVLRLNTSVLIANLITPVAPPGRRNPFLTPFPDRESSKFTFTLARARVDTVQDRPESRGFRYCPFHLVRAACRRTRELPSA
jgi:DNA-binding transcriptional LysR family regulator